MQQEKSATLKAEVKKQYGKLVSTGSGGCCGPSCGPDTSTMKGNLVKEAGYASEELHGLPAGAVENSFGCGNPLAFAEVQPGQTVVDIGSGAGIDCFLAAQRVGHSGKVIGIDMTTEMLEKATENARAGGFQQVEFRRGEAEAMPVDDTSVDWVISNCVINLSPNKPAVFTEIARILKPGGRFSISDIVIGDDLPDEIANNIAAWTGCVAGAIKESDYLDGLRNAGLEQVRVESRIVYDEATLLGLAKNYDLPEESMKELVGRVAGKIWSAKISGVKAAEASSPQSGESQAQVQA